MRSIELLPEYGRKLVKSELIEIRIPINTGAPKTKIQLPDNQNLRNSYLWDIELFIQQDTPISIATHTEVVGRTLAQSIFLTLQAYNGKNFSWQRPIIGYHKMFNQNPDFILMHESDPVRFTGQKVNWPKSYIEIADPTLISTLADQVVLLDISYSEFANVEKKDRKAGFRKQS